MRLRPSPGDRGPSRGRPSVSGPRHLLHQLQDFEIFAFDKDVVGGFEIHRLGPVRVQSRDARLLDDFHALRLARARRARSARCAPRPNRQASAAAFRSRYVRRTGTRGNSARGNFSACRAFAMPRRPKARNALSFRVEAPPSSIARLLLMKPSRCLPSAPPVEPCPRSPPCAERKRALHDVHHRSTGLQYLEVRIVLRLSALDAGDARFVLERPFDKWDVQSEHSVIRIISEFEFTGFTICAVDVDGAAMRLSSQYAVQHSPSHLRKFDLKGVLPGERLQSGPSCQCCGFRDRLLFALRRSNASLRRAVNHLREIVWRPPRRSCLSDCG